MTSVVSRTSPTEQVESAAEGDPGAGAGLEKHAGENGPLEDPGNPGPVCVNTHVIRDGEDPVDVGPIELVYG